MTDIIVCGHYRCGAVKALLHPEEGGALPKVRAWLAHAAATKVIMDRDFPHLAGDERWDTAVERNVLVQVENLSRHPVVAAGLAAGTLRLHAWVLRFESGDVAAYDPHAGSFRPLLDMPAVHAALPVPDGGRPAPPPADPAPPPAPPARWGETLRADLAASLVVFMVALPLCLAIAKACGVPSGAGIITAVIGGTVVGLLGGGSVQVSGPTAGLIVILLGAGDRLGIASLGVVVLLAGLLQVAAGFLRLGRWFRAVSPAVVLGMLAGIGVVLFAQQVHVVVDEPPSRSRLANLLDIPRAVADIARDHGHPGHLPAALTGVLTLAVLLLWGPLARPRSLTAVPAVLVAVGAATVASVALGLPIQRVDFDGLGAGVTAFDFTKLPGLLGDGAVWRLAAAVAFVASAETLLTAAAVDQMHSGPRTRYDRELAAQGVGNALCGLVGALPMASVIVRSAANVRAGAKSRWAAVFHGVWILAFALLLPGVLRLLPAAAMAAVLVLTGLKLIEIRAIRSLWREDRGEALICIATAAAVVSADLVAGILLGVGLSVVKLIRTFSRLLIRRLGDPAGGRVTLVLEGSATFLSLPKLAAALEAVPPGAALRVDFKGLSYIDHACLDLVVNWGRRHEATGGTLVLDWDILRSRFRSARPRPRTTTDAGHPE